MFLLNLPGENSPSTQVFLLLLPLWAAGVPPPFRFFSSSTKSLPSCEGRGIILFLSRVPPDTLSVFSLSQVPVSRSCTPEDVLKKVSSPRLFLPPPFPWGFALTLVRSRFFLPLQHRRGVGARTLPVEEVGLISFIPKEPPLFFSNPWLFLPLASCTYFQFLPRLEREDGLLFLPFIEKEAIPDLVISRDPSSLFLDVPTFYPPQTFSRPPPPPAAVA